MQLKGKTEAVGVHRLLGLAASAPGRRPGSEFVGRGARARPSLGAVDGGLARPRVPARDRHRRCGRREVPSRPGVPRARGSTTRRSREGRCLPYGEGITYWPLKEAIGQAAELRGDETADEARARIRGLLRDAPDADLVTERIAETIGIADAVPEHKGATWAVGRLIEEVARRRPLVVVLDDIQWAEDVFLDLVEHIVHGLEDTPLLVLCMARPELLDARLAWTSADDRSTLIFLRPLSDDDSGQLIENLLDGGTLEDAARARIIEASDGLPLFVEEMVAMLIDDGALRRDNGRWVAADLSRIAAPASIHALLAARLDQLDPVERAVLERGAVEGQVFHRSAVEFLSPEAERPGVPEGLSALVLKELVEPDGRRVLRRRRLPLPSPSTPRRRLRIAAEGSAGWAARALRVLARRPGRRARERVRRDRRVSPRAGSSLPGGTAPRQRTRRRAHRTRRSTPRQCRPTGTCAGRLARGGEPLDASASASPCECKSTFSARAEARGRTHRDVTSCAFTSRVAALLLALADRSPLDDQGPGRCSLPSLCDLRQRAGSPRTGRSRSL